MAKKGRGQGISIIGIKFRVRLGFKVRLGSEYRYIEYTYTICPMCPLYF